MRSLGKSLKWISCALILMMIGALAACSPDATAIPVATSTLIPVTITLSPTPFTPSPIPTASITPVATAAATVFAPILPLSITPDVGLTNRIIEDLATELTIATNRVQVVSIEEANFSVMSMNCFSTTGDSTIDPVPRQMVAGYRYVLLVGDTLYEYHSLGLESFRRCPSEEALADELLIMLDPFAADTLRIVQNLLAEELDISSRRIQLVTMQTVLWQDTSLGCPKPEQSYSPAQILGYRVVVMAGDIEYIYHSDASGVYPCAAADEVLP